MKIREFRDKNYKAIYFNGKTIRLTFDPKKPIEELDYPEFYDIKITGYCRGNCPYCYQSSSENQEHYDTLNEIEKFFGKMSYNEKPLQIAYGGGEPTEHPDFIKILELTYNLGITPNYTTNGMNITNDIIEATKKYCGGVAISTHPHLYHYWTKALDKFRLAEVKINLHHIISDRSSIDTFIYLIHTLSQAIDYIVLLPYIAKGRAEKKEIDYDYLEEKLDSLGDLINKVAFGAYFYDFLKKRNKKYGISLYEPEIMSKYLDLKDGKVYASSFV